MNIVCMAELFIKHLWPDFGKLTKLSHLIFQEILILNTQATPIGKKQGCHKLVPML